MEQLKELYDTINERIKEKETLRNALGIGISYDEEIDNDYHKKLFYKELEVNGAIKELKYIKEIIEMIAERYRKEL